jgi:methyl-accepting chemotaxis protein
MQGNLARTVQEIQQGSAALSASAGEIAAGNADLSVRTESQAASLERTAASMHLLTTTVRQNAGYADQADRLGRVAAERARRGGEVVGRVVDTMGAIQSSSRKIVEIIAVIDGIAFQTNILALNAAVEAARAGPSGRGFAVVASEVRNLAQRSAAAAMEIKALINESVAQVGCGGVLVEQARAAMAEMSASATEVAAIMGQITATGAAQGAGIDEVNLAITQLDSFTQQNAALVEQAAAAAESMHGQSLGLARAVALFDPGAAPAGAAAAPTRPRRPVAAPAPSLPLRCDRSSSHARA